MTVVRSLNLYFLTQSLVDRLDRLCSELIIYCCELPTFSLVDSKSYVFEVEETSFPVHISHVGAVLMSPNPKQYPQLVVDPETGTFH